MPPKAVTTHNLAPLRSIDMGTETTDAENTLSEQEAPREPGSSSPIEVTSIIKLIRLQSDFKDRIKEQYEFRNTPCYLKNKHRISRDIQDELA
jgi:hypothetical protein